MVETPKFVVEFAKTFPLCNVRVNFSKCQILVVFEQFFFNFYFKNGPFSYIIAHASFSPKFSCDFVAELGGKRHVNSTGILYPV